jgi:trehalose 6-phosphate phosphatase
MENLLLPESQAILTQFVASKTLLALDYDGTLAPIVDDPTKASIRPRTRELLTEVARLYPTIVITGRAQDDALRRLRGVGVYGVIGNHGLEPWHAHDHLIAVVRSWLDRLAEPLRSVDGVRIEDKVFSLAIHYRLAPDKPRARVEISRAVAELDRVRVVGGKQVVNLIPEGVPHKGIALERERVALGCDAAIYVGDDETDEDVFSAERVAPLLSVRIGASRESAASYYLPRQRSINELLSTLVRLKNGNPRRAA